MKLEKIIEEQSNNANVDFADASITGHCGNKFLRMDIVYECMDRVALEKQIELLEELHRSNMNTNALFRADLRVRIDDLQNQLQKLKG